MEHQKQENGPFCAVEGIEASDFANPLIDRFGFNVYV